MKMPHRSIAPLLLALSALFSQAPALATAPARAESGSATAAAGTEKPKRSFWDILHFRKKADEPSQEGPAPVPEAPAPAPKKRAAAVAAAPEAPKAVEAAGMASPKALAKAQARLRAGAGGNDPVVRVFLDKIDRGEARSADLNALATVLAKKGMAEDALSYQTEAVRIDRKNPTLQLNLGTLQRDLGHTSAAMSAYRRALALDPNFALAHYNIGTLLDAGGSYDDAIAEYRTALSLDPTLADPVKNPQIVNNDRLMVVNLLLYRQKAGALGLPLVPVKGAAREGGR